MIVLTRLSVWLSLTGVLFTAWILGTGTKQEAMPEPLVPPPQSPYRATVAASGIVEAVNENVRIAPPLPALVTKVYVKVGDRRAAGDPLLQLDERELLAQLGTREAAIPPLQAQIEEQRLRIGDLETQLNRLKAVRDKRAVSEDEVKRTWYALQMARQALVRFQSNHQQALAQRDETTLLLDRLTVRAPRGGTILQVNVRAGEYAAPGSAEPLILLGDTEQWQVRAEVDEVNAPLVPYRAPAVASLKGRPDLRISLSFERIEPYVVPKRSLTGDNTERVDTRVLQIIYRFEPPIIPIYAGQQVDVFISRDSAERTESTP